LEEDSEKIEGRFMKVVEKLKWQGKIIVEKRRGNF